MRLNTDRELYIVQREWTGRHVKSADESLAHQLRPVQWHDRHTECSVQQSSVHFASNYHRRGQPAWFLAVLGGAHTVHMLCLLLGDESQQGTDYITAEHMLKATVSRAAVLPLCMTI